jgi:NADPH:quinone reductase-like Zn-dependent oxidoreductase
MGAYELARSASIVPFHLQENAMQTATRRNPRSPDVPATMKASALDTYGGPEVLRPHDLPVPPVGPDEVLIEVAAAGVGVWDAKQRNGDMAGMGPKASFPIVPGADGAGTIVAVGERVKDFKPGDEVYGYSFLSPKGGFYAGYAVVPADAVAKIPAGLDIAEAGALGVTAITALRGLDDHLHVKEGDRVLIFGASGGVGDPAVQLAKAMGAQVLAVVTSDDGAALVRERGADVIVNLKRDDLAAALRKFAPDGLDAVLAVVAGDGLDTAIAAIRVGGRLAHPNGVTPPPKARPGIAVEAYDGRPDRALLDKLNGLIESRPFSIKLSGRFPLADAAKAHREMEKHHLGRMVLTVS